MFTKKKSSNWPIQKDELFDFREDWKMGGIWPMPPTGQRVAGDAMDFGVTEIRNKRAEKLGG